MFLIGVFLNIFYYEKRMNKKIKDRIKSIGKRILSLNSSLKFFFIYNLFKNLNIKNLNLFEKRVYSQNGEDGIIEYIFHKINTTNKYYVEFGAEDGSECNTRLLRGKKWRGLLLDRNSENKKINLKKEFITAENIEDLFIKYHVPKKFDLLSIDIDFNDYYVWKAIKNYSPRLIIIEYNSSVLFNESKAVKYDSKRSWDGTDYFGASLLALKKLGKMKGYTLICCDTNGINAFFVKKNLSKNFKIREYSRIFKKPNYGKNKKGHRKSREKMIYV